MTREELVALVVTNEALLKKQERENEAHLKKITELELQLTWFKRYVFGQRTEKRILKKVSNNQMYLGEMFEVKDPETPPPPTETVKKYERRQRRKFPNLGDESSQLKFDDTVPVEVIEVPNPEIEGLAPEQYDELGEEHSYRIVQKRSPYGIIKYVKKKYKLKGSGKIVSAPSPAAVIERSVADVSFLAGMVIDKLQYHLPLYRQHQRLERFGIHLSRGTLPNLMIRVSQLLEPVYQSQFSSILQSSVLAMDETPIKAGRDKPGKMHQSYFWPIYGDKGEIVFLYSTSHSQQVVSEALGEYSGVLITDGYKVYENYAEQFKKVTHAQCWAHTRRKFDEAKEFEPELCDKALEFIGKMYAVEAEFRDEPEKNNLGQLRDTKSRPVVDEFFKWLNETLAKQALLPSNPFTSAANYALNREKALRVFLDNPQVPIDTNHVERALRPIPMGRKNWLFCWSEEGARCVGILQSLIISCQMQEVDPYTYLVDVLQRIDTHPVIDIHLLTPRLWKDNFASNPLRSIVDKIV